MTDLTHALRHVRGDYDLPPEPPADPAAFLLDRLDQWGLNAVRDMARSTHVSVLLGAADRLKGAEDQALTNLTRDGRLRPLSQTPEEVTTLVQEERGKILHQVLTDVMAAREKILAQDPAKLPPAKLDTDTAAQVSLLVQRHQAGLLSPAELHEVASRWALSGHRSGLTELLPIVRTLEAKSPGIHQETLNLVTLGLETPQTVARGAKTRALDLIGSQIGYVVEAVEESGSWEDDARSRVTSRDGQGMTFLLDSQNFEADLYVSLYGEDAGGQTDEG